MPRNIRDTFIIRMPTDSVLGIIPPTISILSELVPRSVTPGDEIEIPFHYTVGYPKLPVITAFVATYTSTPSGSVLSSAVFIPRTTFQPPNTGPTEPLSGSLHGVIPTGGTDENGSLSITVTISIFGTTASNSITLNIEEIAGLLTITPEYTPQEVLPGDDFEVPFVYRLGNPKSRGDFEVGYESTPGQYSCSNNVFTPRAPVQSANGMDIPPEQEQGAILSATAPELRTGETANPVRITGTITMRQPES